jgi:hypothetical protein
MQYTIQTCIRHLIIRRDGEIFAIIPPDDFVAIGAALGIMYDTETPPF